MVARGVRVKVVLIDNRSIDTISMMVKDREALPGQEHQTRDRYLEEARTVWNQLRNLRDRVTQGGPAYKGSLEIRFLQKVFLNSIWVRDSSLPENALGHIQASFYGNDRRVPVLRFGQLSPDTVSLIQEQFDHIWDTAIPAVD